MSEYTTTTIFAAACPATLTDNGAGTRSTDSNAILLPILPLLLLLLLLPLPLLLPPLLPLP